MSTAADTLAQVLTFSVTGERVSLPAGDVVEIIRPRAWTRVPNMPASLLGICNFRGAALPVLSLSRLLGLSEPAQTQASRVIVVDQGQTVGLLVDAIAALTQTDAARPIDLKALLATAFDRVSLRAATGRAVAAPSAAVTPAPTQTGIQLLCFATGGQEFALPVADVEAVSKLPAGITGVPGTDEAMLGVMELRGALVPLVSLRTLLGLDGEGFMPDAARVIVTRVGADLVGLVSDDVRAVVTVASDAIDAVPPVLTRGTGEAQIHAICRMPGGRLVSVLAQGRLFDTQTSARIAGKASSGTQAMTQASSVQSADEKFLIFNLHDEVYGLPIASVDRIVRHPEKLTRVPRAPAFVQGVMSIAGRIVPIIDQGLRFAVARADVARNRKIIVLTIAAQQFGFAVDKVSEIIAIPQAELRSAPVLDDEAPVIDRVAMFERDGRVIMLLNPKALLDTSERDILAKLAAEGDTAAS